MGLLDDVLKEVVGGNASAADVPSVYERVAGAVPQSTLADALAHAFNSEQTPPLGEMLAGLFGKSSPDQKAGLLNQILRTIGPQLSTQILGAAGLGDLATKLSQGGVTPQQAQQVPPDAVQAMAEQAAKTNPSVVDAAASFYAQHPTLVKTIGAGALALLMSKISQDRTS